MVVGGHVNHVVVLEKVEKLGSYCTNFFSTCNVVQDLLWETRDNYILYNLLKNLLTEMAKNDLNDHGLAQLQSMVNFN